MEADSSYQLASNLIDFVFARDGDERRALLQAYPELLSEEADFWLEEYTYQAQEAGDWQAERAYAEHRQLLAECRQWGADALQGFFSYTELETLFAYFAISLRDMNARKAYLRWHPELLGEKTRQVIEESIAVLVSGRQKDLLRRFRLCRNLLCRCRCRSPQEAFTAYRPPRPEVLHAVNAVLFAGGARLAIEAALSRSRLLSRPDVINAFNYLYPYYEDDPFRQGQLDHLRQFLNGMYGLGIKSPDQIVAEFNLSRIAAGLQRLYTEDAGFNSLIVSAEWVRNCSIQITARRGDPLLFLEAVSSQETSSELLLGSQEAGNLRRLGWKPNPENPLENYCLLWRAVGDEDLLALARRVIRTFEEVYGVPPQREYSFEIHPA